MRTTDLIGVCVVSFWQTSWGHNIKHFRQIKKDKAIPVTGREGP
jgi:hypothetical protein